ncbi:electron transfer flavoprotein subunit alpha/FixB family protein [Solirubrobacter soli]|uniref:electron transfer flavoprotein subunit alpha/FixB family protein n=1 Tax=Solirubrobacter soli TaxID=363832 RepID=UPI00048519BD|nr:electron transfer flavoprotein subunit alpha/FixB family protein [Solirubrobacter soli]
MSGVLVIAEARRGELRDVSLELLTAAATIGGPVDVLLVGDAPTEALSGADTVLVGRREHYEPHVAAAAAKAAIERFAPDVILAPHSVDAMGYAPAVAAELGLGFASDVTGVNPVTRGAYGDRLVATLEFDGPALLMVRPGAFEGTTATGTATVEELAVDESVAVVEHLGYVEAEAGDVDITTSGFLLSIGRGVEDADGVAEFEEIAERISATLAVSRPLVDAGFVPAARQVGQSGKTVKPKVYLALGISGAIQHLAGMRKADTIIAVNTDPEAPIFQVAHYGAVADLYDVARALPPHFE